MTNTCEKCSKVLQSFEIFGKPGQTLCFACDQRWNNPPKLLLAESTVWTCTSCGAWAGRFPDFMGDDGFWQCGKCGNTSVNQREGRPYGPKCKDWDWIEREFNDMISVLGVKFIEDVKTDPPMEDDECDDEWYPLEILVPLP